MRRLPPCWWPSKPFLFQKLLLGIELLAYDVPMYGLYGDANFHSFINAKISTEEVNILLIEKVLAFLFMFGDDPRLLWTGKTACGLNP